MEHDFTPVINAVLTRHFGTAAQDLFEKSPLLQYINLKTVSATRGSKSRSSFANLYAIYVLAEDYVAHGFHKKGDYSKYEGAQFSKLFTRQRELPFGSKLQNHGLGVAQGYLDNIMTEIVSQSKVEFNYEDSDDDENDEE